MACYDLWSFLLVCHIFSGTSYDCLSDVALLCFSGGSGKTQTLCPVDTFCVRTSLWPHYHLVVREKKNKKTNVLFTDSETVEWSYYIHNIVST